jgi:hypothetical protein
MAPFHRPIRTAAAVVTILSFATAAAAQTERARPQPQADVLSLLKSGDARLEAWGAWYAGAGEVRSAALPLQDVVRTRLRAPGAMNPTLDIALDALIQLRVPLDADLLADVYAVRPVQALIAASFAGDPDDFLDEVLRSAEGNGWLAAANLLIARNPRRLVPHALAGLRLKLTILVVDPGTAAGIGVGAGVGRGCGLGILAPGIPPWAGYELTPFASSGLTILAMGPKPIYYRRRLAPAGQSPAAGVDAAAGPTAHDRLAYAAAAAGIESEQLPLRGIEQSSLSVPHDGNLADVVARVRADFVRRYDLFLRMLVGRGALADDAAAVYPARIHLEVVDRRTAPK